MEYHFCKVQCSHYKQCVSVYENIYLVIGLEETYCLQILGDVHYQLRSIRYIRGYGNMRSLPAGDHRASIVFVGLNI